jgi:hypothetical protein
VGWRGDVRERRDPKAAAALDTRNTADIARAGVECFDPFTGSSGSLKQGQVGSEAFAFSVFVADRLAPQRLAMKALEPLGPELVELALTPFVGVERARDLARS